MKRTILIVALATIMVLAFAGTAFARGYSPANRSSAFLGASTEAYVTWDTAKTQMTVAGVAAADQLSVHGNYTTTTVKCQVCHSAHKAAAAGDTLLQSTAAQACVPCHLGATATANSKVSAGNRHGATSGCTNGYCHSTSPHGGGDISKYATLKTAMLTNHADSLLDAAIASGVSGVAEPGYIFTTASDMALPASRIATITVLNPGVTAAILNDVSDAGAVSFGRAIGTGYVCANGGCHINGQFNSLTENSTFGVWDGPITVTEPQYVNPNYDASYETSVPAGTYYPGDTFTNAWGTWDAWDVLHGDTALRQAPIKGHTLAAVADLGVRDVAFANVGTCSSCHDSIDYRISPTTKQFPHGNSRVLPDGTVPKVAGKDVPNEAWFTVGAHLGSADTTLTTNSATSAYRSGSDGACLKCHRDGTNGVGIDY